MNSIKKKKIRSFFKKNKVWIISVGSFAVVGATALLLGFEIANDWHAIRNWLASPYATTFFICLILGLAVLVILILALIVVKNGDK